MCVGSILKVNKRRERLPRRLPVRFSTSLLHNVGTLVITGAGEPCTPPRAGILRITSDPYTSGEGLASPVALAAYWQIVATSCRRMPSRPDQPRLWLGFANTGARNGGPTAAW